MTGFGRTGELFAHQKAKTSPDFICLSKGLTGGFLPLSLTITKQKVFEAFYDDHLLHTFYHGHSYTANPLSCAAALASIRELPKYLGEIQRIEQLFSEFIHPLLQIKSIEKVRQTGTIVAFDIKTNESRSYFNQGGNQLKKELLVRGFNIRPLGNTIYLMPPYITESKYLKNLIFEILNFFEF
jgi:adenosylmethionine-8-amino-7-oxononanoate aminotransferase